MQMKPSILLALVLVFLPIVSALTPQWRGLINGTVIYIALGGIALCFFVCIAKPNRPLYITSVILTTVCTWMLWACCYMSQMYPILYPVITASASSHGGEDGH